MRSVVFSAMALGLALSQPVAAQDYPTRPIELIVPYSPGGVTDLTARLLADRMQEELGQPIVVVNRPGGNAAIGVGIVAGAAPDGYTLLMSTSAEAAVAPALRDDLPYNMDTDLAPITLINDTPIVVVASVDSGFQTIDDLVSAGMEREIPFSSASVGSSHHILGESIAYASGADFLHIAYQGGAPSAAAVASGEVEFGVISISTVVPHIEAGRVIPLAVASAERTAALPDVPTLVESGLDLTTSVWIGLFAPAGTPDDIIERVNTVMQTVLADETIIERFAATGAVPIWSTPEGLTEYRRANTEGARVVIQGAGITVD
jgi:tripartite-type tricarboxylate transporter receptor subunit TctC